MNLQGWDYLGQGTIDLYIFLFPVYVKLIFILAVILRCLYVPRGDFKTEHGCLFFHGKCPFLEQLSHAQVDKGLFLSVPWLARFPYRYDGSPRDHGAPILTAMLASKHVIFLKTKETSQPSV